MAQVKQPDRFSTVSEPVENSRETVMTATARNSRKTGRNKSKTAPKTATETAKQSPLGEAKLFRSLARIPSRPLPSQHRSALRCANVARLATTEDLDMTDDITPTRQAIAAKNWSGKLTVSGKLKAAVDLMLYEGSCRADAAKAAGMTDHSLREAFKKPHVKAYYNAGLDVLRTSERAKNISALARIRDNSENGMAVVSAAKALEQLSETETAHRGHGLPTAPGLQIVIVQPGEPVKPRIINVAPNKDDAE